MKKLLVAALALTTMSAFAGNSMVKMDGCFDGQCENLNFSMDSETVESTAGDDDTANMTIAVNYAMAFAGNFGAGVTYVSKNKTTDGDVGSVGDKMNMIGLSGYWNKDGSWDDSCFGALHYNMTTVDDSDAVTDSGNKMTDIVLEFGHRFKVGTLAGFNFNWVPSVTYTMSTTSYNSDADDDSSTSLSLNMANVAATF
jgi:hypothetical protein